MARRYWDPELETMPWDEVLAWQAARTAPFVRGLPGRSEFHRALLGAAPPPPPPPRRPGPARHFRPAVPFTPRDDTRRSQADPRPGEPFGRHQGVPLPA